MVRLKDLLAKAIICTILIGLSIITCSNIFATVQDPDPDVVSVKLLPKFTCLMVGSDRKCLVESLPPEPNSTLI